MGELPVRIKFVRLETCSNNQHGSESSAVTNSSLQSLTQICVACTLLTQEDATYTAYLNHTELYTYNLVHLRYSTVCLCCALTV